MSAISLGFPLLHTTILFITLFTMFGVNGLLKPVCDIDIKNPVVGDVVALTCRPADNDTSENITLTWFHDGKNVSIDQRGKVRIKLSAHDYGIVFTCREALSIATEVQNCSIMPLMQLESTTTIAVTTLGSQSTAKESTTPIVIGPALSSNSTTDDPGEDPRQGTITILFIAIVVAGGIPILIAFVACIVWIARKTKGDHNSYDLTRRPRSDSFDDFDPELDTRPAAPLPSEMQIMTSGSSIRNGTPPVLKSLVEKESFYSNTPGAENPYQNTAMGGHSTLPVLSSKNIYLTPKQDLVDMVDDHEDNAKIYENTPSYVNKQHRFESDHTSSLPNFRY